MTVRIWMLLAAVVAGGLACEGPFRPDLPAGPLPPPPPTPRLTVRWETPRADDGAVLIELRGPFIGTTHALDSTGWVQGERLDSTWYRVLVAGDLETGPLLTFEVPTGDAVAAYSGTITGVANRGSEIRTSLDGYRLTITRD